MSKKRFSASLTSMYERKVIQLKKLRDLKKLIEIDDLIASSSAKKSIVLIDACRDNPLSEELEMFFRQRGAKNVSISKGLGQIKVKTQNILIGLATGSNKIADVTIILCVLGRLETVFLYFVKKESLCGREVSCFGRV